LKTYARALACIQEEIAIRQSLGLHVNLARELALLAVIHSDRGNYRQAHAQLAEAMAACRLEQEYRRETSCPLIQIHPSLPD